VQSTNHNTLCLYFDLVLLSYESESIKSQPKKELICNKKLRSDIVSDENSKDEKKRDIYCFAVLREHCARPNELPFISRSIGALTGVQVKYSHPSLRFRFSVDADGAGKSEPLRMQRNCSENLWSGNPITLK